jgi:hypothetical protein
VASAPQPEVWRDVKYITLMPLSRDAGKWLLTLTPCRHHQRSHKNTGRARCLQCEAQVLSPSSPKMPPFGPVRPHTTKHLILLGKQDEIGEEATVWAQSQNKGKP